MVLFFDIYYYFDPLSSEEGRKLQTRASLLLSTISSLDNSRDVQIPAWESDDIVLKIKTIRQIQAASHPNQWKRVKSKPEDLSSASNDISLFSMNLDFHGNFASNMHDGFKNAYQNEELSFAYAYLDRERKKKIGVVSHAAISDENPFLQQIDIPKKLLDSRALTHMDYDRFRSANTLSVSVMPVSYDELDKLNEIGVNVPYIELEDNSLSGQLKNSIYQTGEQNVYIPAAN